MLALFFIEVFLFPVGAIFYIISKQRFLNFWHQKAHCDEHGFSYFNHLFIKGYEDQKLHQYLYAGLLLLKLLAAKTRSFN